MQVLGDVRAWQGEIYVLSDRKIYVAATRLPHLKGDLRQNNLLITNSLISKKHISNH